MKLEKALACVERRRRSVLVVRISLALAALTVVAMDVVRAQEPSRHAPYERLIPVFLACLGVAGLALATRFREFKPADPPGTVTVDGEAIAYDTSYGEGWLPLDEIDEVELKGTGHLELRRTNGDVLHIMTPVRHDKLLAAVDAGGPRRAVRLTLGDPKFATLVGGLLGLPAGVFATYFSANVPSAILNIGVFALSWYGVFTACKAALGPAAILVGVDGVALPKLFSTQFLAFGDLDTIDVRPGRVTFSLKDGRRIGVPEKHMTDEQGAILAERVEGVLHNRRSAEDMPALAELDRLGRPVAAWRGALAGLLASDKTYRRASVTEEDLARLLGNPEVGPERQLGAALALASIDGEATRLRIRRAAYASANRAMHRALGAIADGKVEDVVLEKALASASPTDAGRRAVKR